MANNATGLKALRTMAGEKPTPQPQSTTEAPKIIGTGLSALRALAGNTSSAKVVSTPEQRYEQQRAQYTAASPVKSPDDSAYKLRKSVLTDELNRIYDNSGYDTTGSYDWYGRRMQILDELDRLNEEYGVAPQSANATERFTDVFRSGTRGYAGDMLSAAGTTVQFGNYLQDKSTEEQRAIADSEYAGWITDDLAYSNAVKDYINGDLKSAGILDENKRIADTLISKADNMITQSQRENQRAKEGLGKFGQAVVDIGTNAIQMGMDAVGHAAGLGMIPFFMRAAGGASQEARENGANAGQQFAYGLASGIVEVVAEKLFDIGKLFGGGVWDDVVENSIVSLANSRLGRTALRGLASMISEGGEEVFSDIVNPFIKLIYNETLKSSKDGNGNAVVLNASDVLYDFIIGAAMGGLGFGGSILNGQNAVANEELEVFDRTYRGSIESQQALVDEALALRPSGRADARVQERIDKGKNAYGKDIRAIIRQNEEAIRAQDKDAIRNAAVQQLSKYGETENVEAVAEAISKNAAGERLTQNERRIISQSKYGDRVSNELDPKNIRTGGYNTAWAERLGTNRINAEEYTRLLQQDEEEAAARENAQEGIEIAPASDLTRQTAREAFEELQRDAEVERSIPAYESVEEFIREFPSPEKVTEIFDQAADTDLNEFAAGFRTAYDMGQSGVSASYLTEANVPTLTDAQRTAAYQLGQTDAEAKAVNRDLKTASKQRSGNLQRVNGTVSSEGVTIADMRRAFNDRQKIAYRLLTKFVEATGVNIVLYNSQADSTTGLYPEAQGRFQWKDDSIYIDINSGLNSIKDVNSLGNYTMMRTFAHEFTHFIEKWNAAEYNEFRQFVFETLESRGENVHDLIESMQARDTSGNMTYEQASREVVADAMMDILPDSNLVQQLASEHQNIFRRLLQKLREFTARMKQYYREISSKAPREAQALKENNAYMDSIVQMWDKIAKGAVANYQGANGDILVDQPAKPGNLPKQVTGKKEKARSSVPSETVSAATETTEASKTEAPKQVEQAPQKAAEAQEAPEKVPAKKTTKAAEKKAETSEKPPVVETTAKLEDFGEKIGGARKDWRSEGLYSRDLEDMNERERAANVKKDNVWKKPDYRKLIAGGASRAILYARNEIRKSLNAKLDYRSTWDEQTVKLKQQKYVDTIREIQELAEKAETKADLENMVTWLVRNGYLEMSTTVSTTEKWRSNPALFTSTYYQTLKHLIRNFDNLEKLADKSNFAVDKDSSIPAGFNISQNKGDNATWYITKGHWIIRDNFPTYEDALNYLREAQQRKTKKTRFVPEQLLAVHRKGPDYRGGKNVDGQAYIDTFGFKGGEYGNWMTQKDRQASLDYGYDALMDLSDALAIPPTDISFEGNLNIAFGARGQGLSGASAHYEPLRHVINLTKMKGAGSLAHEWFHALDDFIGGYKGELATARYYDLPSRTKEAVANLIRTMKYKDQSAEEADLSRQHNVERNERRITNFLNDWFKWADKVKNGTLTESETKYFKRVPTTEDVEKLDAIKSRLLNGEIPAIEDLSNLRKEITGHVIDKESRDAIRTTVMMLTPEARGTTITGRKQTDFYNGSQEFDKIHTKDGDYWSSTVEMAARAFSCYITDKTGKNNDYLSAHSDIFTSVTLDRNDNPVVVRAYPVGEERAAINQAFDNLVDAMKADGFLHQADETEKPDIVQYSRRRITSDMTDEERYNVLKDKTISITAKTDTSKLAEYQSKNGVSLEPFPKLGAAQRRKLFRKIAEEFNVFKEYSNKDIELSFSYSAGNLRESLEKQKRNYSNFAKLLSCFEETVDSAIGIEVHNRNAQGYKPDPTLNNVYVLVSAFEDGSSIVPVKLEVKEFSDKPNTLYVAIALESIKKDEVVAQGNTENSVTQYARSSDIRLADLLSNVNPKDESFTKYIPEQFFKARDGVQSQQVTENVNTENFGEDVAQDSRRTAPAMSKADVLEYAYKELISGKVSIQAEVSAESFDKAYSELLEGKVVSYPKKGVKVERDRFTLNQAQKEALELWKKRMDRYRELRDMSDELREKYRAINDSTSAQAESIKKQIELADKKVKEMKKTLTYMEDKELMKQVLEAARFVAERDQRAKGRQELTDYRNRQSNKIMLGKIQKVVKELNTMLLKGNKEKHVPIGLQKPVAEALDAINMDTLGAADRLEALQEKIKTEKDPEKLQALIDKYARLSSRDYKMSVKLKELKAEYDAIKDSNDPLIANAHDEVISSLIDGTIRLVGDTAIADMNAAQLKAVYDMYKAVLTCVRDANRTFADERNRSITELSENVIAETKAAKRLAGRGKERLTLLDAAERFGWKILKPVYAFKTIGSKTLEGLFNNLRAGEDTWAVDIAEARAFSLAAKKKYGYDKWDMKKTYTFTSSSGLDFELSLPQIMSLYAYSRREQAADHLRKGGIVLDRRSEIVKKSKLPFLKWSATDATAYNISIDTLAEIVGTLSGDQTRFVDEMQMYLSETMGGKGNEVTLKMYGIKIFGETYYFPLKSAQQYMAKAKEQQKKSADGGVKIKNSGFTKDVQQGASNPIVVEDFMSVWDEHVNDMAMYHGFVLPLEDFGRVFAYKTRALEDTAIKSVEAAIQNTCGKGAVEYIDIFLRHLNNGVKSDPTARGMGRLISGFKKGAVFANLSVSIQQYSAVCRAWAEIDPKFFRMGKMDSKKHDALWDEVKKYAPVAVIKDMGFFDTSVGRGVNDFLDAQEYEGFEAKAKAFFTDSKYRDEVFGKLPGLMDELAWCRIWEACKREVYTRQGLKGEELLKAAGKRFTEVIVNTQVYDSVFSRNEMMRSKDMGLKMATSFMAEPITTLNMLWNGIMNGKRKGVTFTARSFGACFASLIFNSLLSATVYAGRDDDDDKSYWEKYVKSFIGDVKEGVNLLTYFPFASDIVSIFSGYSVQRSDMSVFSEIYKGWQELGKDDVPAWHKIEDFAGGICKLFGLPLKNVMRDIRGIWQTANAFQNETTGAGLANAIREGWTGKETPRSEQLYEAIVTGNQIQEQRLRGLYKSDSDADSAFRSVIKKKYEDKELEYDEVISMLQKYGLEKDRNAAFWAVNEWDTGEARYKPLKDAIKDGSSAEFKKAFDFLTKNGVKKKDVYSEARIYIGELYKGSDSEEASITKSKATSLLMQYGDYDADDAKRLTDEWQCKVDTGMNYSELREYYVSGELSYNKAVLYMQKYGGKSADDAKQLADKWKFQGSGDEFENISTSAVAKYTEYLEKTGMSKKTYYEAWSVIKDIEGDDLDGDGTNDPYTAMDKKLAYIGSLNITYEQKYALALASGIKESSLNKRKRW